MLDSARYSGRAERQISSESRRGLSKRGFAKPDLMRLVREMLILASNVYQNRNPEEHWNPTYTWEILLRPPSCGRNDRAGERPYR